MTSAIRTILTAVMFTAACGGGSADDPEEAAMEIAPAGTIRAALNFANAVLARYDTTTGEPVGVSAELARELGRRLNRPVEFIRYDSAAVMADSAGIDAWDIAFLAADPAREETIAFTAPYLELDATYLVPAASRFARLEDVDAPGVRIVARPRSAYDLFLRRSITQATLVYPEAGEADIDVLASGRGDVLAGLRHVLVDTARETPDVRVLDGRFAAMGQAIGIPRGSETAASYLRAFVEDLKGSGLVAQAISASGAEGVSVAPPAVDSAP
jgi:polar amino acid transport system substrate-binding protein